MNPCEYLKRKFIFELLQMRCEPSNVQYPTSDLEINKLCDYLSPKEREHFLSNYFANVDYDYVKSMNEQESLELFKVLHERDPDLFTNLFEVSHA